MTAEEASSEMPTTLPPPEAHADELKTPPLKEKSPPSPLTNDAASSTKAAAAAAVVRRDISAYGSVVMVFVPGRWTAIASPSRGCLEVFSLGLLCT